MRVSQGNTYLDDDGLKNVYYILATLGALKLYAERESYHNIHLIAI